MMKTISIGVFLYIAVCFFGMNLLSRKFAEAYYERKWMRRMVMIPVGMVVTVAVIFLIAYVTPNDFIFLLMVPVICFYVGLIANLTFMKVKGYQKLAEKHTPFGSQK